MPLVMYARDLQLSGRSQIIINKRKTVDFQMLPKIMYMALPI